jgi:hypothetical protein
MTSTSFTGVPPDQRDRVVRRADDAPFACVNHPHWQATAMLVAGSLYTTALDLAAYGVLCARLLTFGMSEE